MRMFDTRIRHGKYCRQKDQKDDDEKMIGFIVVYLFDFTDWVPSTHTRRRRKSQTYFCFEYCSYVGPNRQPRFGNMLLTPNRR